jgi:Ankyrin repeats (many copies)
MSRLIIFLCVCTLSDAFAQPSTTSLYGGLERQYEELLAVYVAGGVCPSRSSEVIQKQRALASALSEATPNTGPRVLLFAVTANSLENVRRLAEAGVSRTGDNGSLLHTAASLADPPMLAYLTSIGFGVEDLGGAGGPALLVAATSNRMDNAKWLIDHGANVNATDIAGGLVLRHALVCRDQSLVDFLIKAGAVPDAKTTEAAGKLGLRL